MRDVHEAMAEAEASLAAIDMDKVRFAAMSAPMASVVVDMPHVRLSAEDRAEIKASIAEARAEMAAVHIDRAEIARSLAEARARSEEHTSELQSIMRISYAVFCLEKQKIPHS